MIKKLDAESEAKETSNSVKFASKPSENEKKTGCCMGSTPCSTTAQPSMPATAYNTTSATAPETRKGPKTRVVVKYDVGFHNTIYLRGKGLNLNWDKGTPLKNVKPDEWVWETETPFTTCEFKALINDKRYEQGENHTLTCGATVQYTPKF